MPNLALVATVCDVDAGLETHAATLQRLPYWPLWLPLLRALSVHDNDALVVAGDEVALWLRTVPDTWPLRAEAAALAIADGRCILDDKRADMYGKAGRQMRAWRAVLCTLRERHGEVGDIALTLTCRGDTEDDEPDEEVDESIASSPGHRHRSVNQAFSDACLNTDALHPVIATDPQLAGDILFATLAPRLRRRSRFGSELPWDELGMDRLPKWLVPLYTRGPFLAFLRTAPMEARAFTHRIV